MYMNHTCEVTLEAGRGHQRPWNCWKLSPGLPQEQPVLLPAESSLCPYYAFTCVRNQINQAGAHCSSQSQEAEAGWSPSLKPAWTTERVLAQPELFREKLSQKTLNFSCDYLTFCLLMNSCILKYDKALLPQSKTWECFPVLTQITWKTVEAEVCLCDFRLEFSLSYLSVSVCHFPQYNCPLRKLVSLLVLIGSILC